MLKEAVSPIKELTLAEETIEINNLIKIDDKEIDASDLNEHARIQLNNIQN